jgi:hypothetical protein
MLAIIRLYTKPCQIVMKKYVGCFRGREGVCVGAKEMTSRTYITPSLPPKTAHIFLHNYLTSVHVQPDDGQHQWPKHVVVLNTVNT